MEEVILVILVFLGLDWKRREGVFCGWMGFFYYGFAFDFEVFCRVKVSEL